MSNIDKVRIHNFKAFYTDKEPAEIDFGGKHLLMYGENGSGKSSIYWALYTLFQSETKLTDDIAKYFTPTHDEQLLNYNFLTERPDFEIENGKIIFPKDIGTLSEIEIILKDTTSLKINKDGNHESTANKIRDLHRHSDFITHRLLVNFYNFRNSKEINLWEVFVRDFFPFLRMNRGNANVTLWEKLKEIETNLPFNLNSGTGRFKRSKSKVWQKKVRDEITNFNSDIEYWIGRINTIANDVYKNELKIEDEIEIFLEYIEPFKYEHYIDNIYVKDGKKYIQGTGYAGLNNPRLNLNIRRLNDDGTFSIIHRPQAYLNEAKITQIALSIRFSLFHNTIKPDYPGQFLALDDLLISLDMSNRDIVLDAILNIYAKRFKIYIFTHERAFFNMAKARIDSEHKKEDWLFKEIYGVDKEHTTPQINSSENYITKSIFQYKQKDYPASVNYLRKELEKVLSDNLPTKVKKGDSGEDKSTLDSIIASAIIYLEKLDIDALPLKKCQQYLQILLNPLSHNEDDVDAYETDIKRIRRVIEELKPFLKEIKKCTKEIFPRHRKVNLIITENDTVTVQKFTLELQDELYSITEPNGSVRLSKCKINSLESRTYVNTVLQIKADGNYKNGRWKNHSLDALFNSICDFKTIPIVPNYIDFYETLEGVKLNTLI